MRSVREVAWQEGLGQVCLCYMMKTTSLQMQAGPPPIDLMDQLRLRSNAPADASLHGSDMAALTSILEEVCFFFFFLVHASCVPSAPLLVVKPALLEALDPCKAESRWLLRRVKCLAAC